MFGSGKLKDLESQLALLQSKLDSSQQENGRLTQELESARGRISELEAQLNDFDLERLKEEARASRAEYEGLKELYARKNKDFDENVEEEEQKFAREAALQRFNLDNEIRDNRQANQDYVTSTVKTFGESYNYYLNQIKLLMDALGDVATKTGEALFSGGNDDLKARIGHSMRERLKSGTDSLKGDGGDLLLIANADEEEALPVKEAVEAVGEFAEDVEEYAGDAVDAVEDVAEGVEAFGEEAGEAAESLYEDVIAQATGKQPEE